MDLDRERVSLSLKATQEDPWQTLRPHPRRSARSSRARSPSSFRSAAFVRVEEGIEGLVHISELAERHVELAEQVVQVGDDVMVKVIDIDLERRRISLSLKQANETTDCRRTPRSSTRRSTAWPLTYDEQGNYIYPEGFDPETGEWLEGYDEPARRVGAAVR